MLIEYVKNRRRVNANAQVARVLIAKGLAREVVEVAERAIAAPVASPASPDYQTRMLQAQDQAAPYGFKADGTPRKRPAPSIKQTRT
jgi:hypothetical protein